MFWSWLKQIGNRRTGRKASNEASMAANFVPHADWSLWLAQGQWDRAAVLLEQLRENPPDDAFEMLVPEWERRLADAFLAAGWSDLNTATALRGLRRVDRFPDRGLSDPRFEAFRDAADRLWDLDRARDAGDFRAAAAHLEVARRLFLEAGLGVADLDELKNAMAEDHENLIRQLAAMRILEDQGHSNEALKVSRRILAMAPGHKGALAVAKRLSHGLPAGFAADHGIRETERPVETVTGWMGQGLPEACDPANGERSMMDERHVLGQLSIDRSHTWLVTQADQLSIAPARDARYADLFGADCHEFQLQRDSDGCWSFKSETGLTVDGELARGGCLIDGNRLKLGANGVEFRFFQPRPETGTARLELLNRSSVRGVKGMLLLGELLRIGGGGGAELPHGEIADSLHLVRTREGWKARRERPWMLEGREVAAEAMVCSPCRLRVDSVGIFWEC